MERKRKEEDMLALCKEDPYGSILAFLEEEDKEAAERFKEFVGRDELMVLLIDISSISMAFDVQEEKPAVIQIYSREEEEAENTNSEGL